MTMGALRMAHLDIEAQGIFHEGSRASWLVAEHGPKLTIDVVAPDNNMHWAVAFLTMESDVMEAKCLASF